MKFISLALAAAFPVFINAQENAIDNAGTVNACGTQAIEEEPIRRVNTELIMNEITGRLELSGRQTKRIQKDLENQSKKFDKAMKKFDKNAAEEKKWHDKAEVYRHEMKEISGGINDLIRSYLDDAQLALFENMLAEKAKPVHPEFKPETEPVAVSTNTVPAIEEPAPQTEEAKTVAEKKKRVILKRKNRKHKKISSGNVIPAGSNANVRKKVSRKAETTLPSVVVSPAAVPAPAQTSATEVQENAKASAVPSLDGL